MRRSDPSSPRHSAVLVPRAPSPRSVCSGPGKARLPSDSSDGPLKSPGLLHVGLSSKGDSVTLTTFPLLEPHVPTKFAVHFPKCFPTLGTQCKSGSPGQWAPASKRKPDPTRSTWAWVQTKPPYGPQVSVQASIYQGSMLGSCPIFDQPFGSRHTAEAPSSLQSPPRGLWLPAIPQAVQLPDLASVFS